MKFHNFFFSLSTNINDEKVILTQFYWNLTVERHNITWLTSVNVLNINWMFHWFLFQVFQKFRRNFRPVLAKTSTWWRRDAGIATKTFAIRVSMLIRLLFCSHLILTGLWRNLKLFNCCSVLTFIWNHCKNRIRLRDRFVKFDQTQRQQQLTIN